MHLGAASAWGALLGVFIPSFAGVVCLDKRYLSGSVDWSLGAGRERKYSRIALANFRGANTPVVADFMPPNI